RFYDPAPDQIQEVHAIRLALGAYLITGLGRGVGQELARALLLRGERVLGTLRDPVQARL
ncbi:MAG TPA: hypothetical protein VFF38_12570, partial [Microvirga sp.]|nr:hypothetical protein [Microvirga sp.]